MSDIVDRLRDYRGGDVRVWKAIEEAADEIIKLRAALHEIDMVFQEAAQDDCENGVSWLNKRAALTYLKEYPHTSAAISFAHKAAQAALGERT